MKKVNHLYSYNQWKWLVNRHKEGYSITQLATFAGVTRNTIRHNFIRLNYDYTCLKDMDDLESRRVEFLKEGGEIG